MTMSLGNHEIHNFEDDRLIDRLVDGELPDRECRELLLRLETEPNGWRRCAMAFLEAQNWRAAFGPLADTARTVPRPAIAPAGRTSKRSAWLQVARFAALAAALVAAVALGWSLHGGHAQSVSDAANASTNASGIAGASASLQSAQSKLAASESQPADGMEMPASLDPMVKHWERRGYRAESQQRLMSMELQDGRRLKVPIREVRLQYIGDRTY
jgi:anti-sigma factor RsiW